MAKHRTTEQQLAAAEERLNELRKRQRTEATRRRVLVGAMLLGRAERDPVAHHHLMRELDSWLTADRDRRLFELGPIRGLYGATLFPPDKPGDQPKQQQPRGWAFGKKLAVSHNPNPQPRHQKRKLTVEDLDELDDWDSLFD